MTPRLTSGVLVSALIRRAQADGGGAAVLAKGDANAGAVIVILAQRGAITGLFEHGHDLNGRAEWRRSPIKALESYDKISDFIDRRRANDPDLWVVELDIADSERFAAEMNDLG